MTLVLLGAVTLTVRRRADGTLVDGSYVPGAETPFDIVASVQPITGRELQSLPEGMRTRAQFVCYTESELRTVTGQALPDVVEYQGRDLEVQNVEDWTAHTTGLPHYRFLLMEPGEDGL